MSTDTRSRCLTKYKHNGTYDPLRVVVLCFCVLNRQKKNTGQVWGRNHLKLIRQIKSNLMGSIGSHFYSEGLYYSYGNKGSYVMIDNSSVGQYLNKSYDDQVKI